MSLDALETTDVIEVMENYIFKNRPPEEIRDKLDLSYRIEGQSIIIYEISPQWNNPEAIMHNDVAKTTFVKNNNKWKIFWLRSNLKWYPYEPQPLVDTLKQFTDIVEEDKYHCFWG